MNPARWENPRAAFDGTRRQIPPLFTELRKRFGEVEYLRVTEITAAGWPHYHFLVRSGYLPHAVIKAKWDALTGASIVDVRTVDQRWRAYTYLLKYLSKIHKIEWTERHCSSSRGFFPAEEKPQGPELDLADAHVIPQHPASFLVQHEPGVTLEHLRGNVYLYTSANTPTPEEF